LSVPFQTDLKDCIDLSKATVLNSDGETSLASVLNGTGLLKSDEDVDEQLLIFVPFKTVVKVHDIVIQADDNKSAEGECLQSWPGTHVR